MIYYKKIKEAVLTRKYTGSIVLVFFLVFLIGCSGESKSSNITTATSSMTTFESSADDSSESITTQVPSKTGDLTSVQQTTQDTSTEVSTIQTTTVEATTLIPTTTEGTSEITTLIQYVTVFFENELDGSSVVSMEGISGQPFVMPDDPVKNGYVFKGWFLEDTLTTPFNINQYPESDITVYAKWEKLITISFNLANGSSTEESRIGQTGDAIQMPIDPTRNSYVFGGWYTNTSYTTPFILTTFPENDMVVYANWIEEVTTTDEMINVLKDEFSFTCVNNVCELQESINTYTFNLNNVTFTKVLLDDDTSGDEQT